MHHLNPSSIVWNNLTGEPLFSKRYNVTHKRWNRFVEAMGRRSKGNWKLARRMLTWKRGEKPMYVTPRLKKTYNRRHFYNWSREYIEDTIADIRMSESVPITKARLALRWNVCWRTVHRQLTKFKVSLDYNPQKPLNLYSAPPPSPIYKSGQRRMSDGW